MNSAASLTELWHKCVNTFASLFGTLVRTKARQNTQDIDCKQGDDLFQWGGTFTSEQTIPRGHLLQGSIYFMTGHLNHTYTTWLAILLVSVMQASLEPTVALEYFKEALHSLEDVQHVIKSKDCVCEAIAIGHSNQISTIDIVACLQSSACTQATLHNLYTHIAASTLL